MKEVKVKGEYFILAGICLVLVSAILGGAIVDIIAHEDQSIIPTMQIFNYDEAVERNSVITVYGYDVENNVKEFAIYTTNPEQIKIYDFEDILDVEGTYIYSFVNQKRAIIDVRTDK